LLRDPTRAVSFQRFDFRDGLPGAGQMNWTCSTAVEASDGRLWFATDDGLGWIDPDRIQTNELPPPVAVRSINTDHAAFDAAHNPRLPKGTSRLRIDYTALSLSIPERVQFRFRLEGYDEAWRDAGTRRTAFYTGLRPGSYRFQVVAANNDGVWNTQGAAAGFSIAPAFYQTNWFAVCCVLAVAGALWLSYLMRVRQVAGRLQKLHDERVDERMRIAHELHDTLLQGFLSASMQLHVASESIPTELPAKAHVRRVLSLMDNVIGDGRNAVRDLRSHANGSAPELEHAFTRIQQELIGADAVDFRVVVNGRVRRLQPVVRDEVFRIGRESLANAFRHARAQSIEAELHYLAGALRVVVRDDGRGIDPEVLRAGRDGHWGLAGMRERSQRLGARLMVRSRVGSGTEVELIVPGRIAFADGASPGWFDRLKDRRVRSRAATREE
jgi:signal transduction histidine kinase